MTNPASLVLNLYGLFQSWGTSSRYRHRLTDKVPSLSAMVGLMAAAEGRPRTADMSDLAELPMAVRVDNPGKIHRDYQIQTTLDSRGIKKLPGVREYFDHDAYFVVAIEFPTRQQAEDMAYALNHPAFSPLYLGRKSCPVPADLVRGVVDSTAEDAVRAAEWRVPTETAETLPPQPHLSVVREVPVSEPGWIVHDRPLSFERHWRRYAPRHVGYVEPVVVDNPHSRQGQTEQPTPSFFFEVFNQ